MAPPLCRCKMPARHAETKKAGPNHRRPFWSCAATDSRGCDFFQWDGPPRASAAAGPAGPSAAAAPARQQPDRIDGQCGQCRAPVAYLTVSSQNARGNQGRRYYQCSACDKFKWLTPAATPSSEPATSINFYAVTDRETLSAVQALLAVPPGVRLGVGRDYTEQRAVPYDYLEVAHAWRVINREKQARFDSFRQGLTAAPPVALREAHAAAAAALRRTQCMRGSVEPRAEANEALLLHGTKPHHLHSILFEGLAP